MIRDDLSDKLIHLTRKRNGEDSAFKSLMAILQEEQLRGGTGRIRGEFKCVCFSEAPIGQLGRILAQPMAHNMRYRPFGVMVSKEWLFKKGGRPVIYQPEDEFGLLHESQQYRHVDYDPTNNVDYTWEREWRIRTDELHLERDFTTVVLPDREREREILKPHEDKIQRIWGVTDMPMPSSVIKQPWHFIVLEDLGVPMP